MFVFSAVDDTIELEAVTFTVFKGTTAQGPNRRDFSLSHHLRQGFGS